MYNQPIAMRYIYMSNLTPEDVDLKLTSVHEKLNEEDMRLWEGLEDEKISRIAGDEANKKFTLQVQNENQGTESRLSTEVIHRSEGDLVNVGSLNALAQAMSEYRIKTDLELANEAIARQQLGVTLDTKINNFVASWDHTTMSIYSAIQAVQDDVTMKNYAMDMRIRKYEDMLQDITTDSIQITMDNGEINMGAWTILSQAREWDLEILGKFKDYKVQTDKDINDAIEDIQNKLPVTEEIIKEAIEALSNAPIIKELENEIGSLEVTIDGVSKTMMEHRIDVQNEMINLSKELGDKVTAETNARVDALNKETTDRINEIQKETAVRTEQFRQLDDGLTVEIQERIDGDNKAYELIENLKSSNETNLADVYQKIAVNTSDISANASKIEQVTAEVQVAQGDANQALVNAATALEQANSAATATNALAERVTQTETKLGEKVDAVVFNQTKSEVERIDGVTKAQGQEITTIKGNVETMDGVVKGHTTAIDAITSTQSAQGDKINQVTERTTVLEGKVSTLNSGLEANTTAVNNLKTEVDKNGQDIKTVADNTTKLSAKVDGLRSNGANLLRKSNVPVVWNPNDIKYPHGHYSVSEPWVEGETYTLTWCVTHKSSATATGDTWLSAYAGGGLQQIQSENNTGDRKVYVKQFVKDGQNLANAVVHFYLLNYNNDRNATATVHWAVLTRGPSIGVSYWEPCAADLEDGIANSASAEALSNLRAEVVAIDGRVTSTANDLTTLKGTVDKNQADLIANYYTKVNTDSAIAAQVNSLKANISKSGRNYVRNTGFPRRNAYWAWQDLLTEKLTGEVTISFDIVENSGAPADGGVGFNMNGDGGNGGFKYVWWPTMSTGHKTWTGTVDSENYKYFGIYTNTNCTITNVKVEKGNIETQWSIAPEDVDAGGRNLLTNSDFKKGLETWSVYNSSNVRTVEYNMEGKLIKYVFISGVPSGTVGGIYKKPADFPYAIQRGDIMTISFYARGDGRVLVGFDDAYEYITLDSTFRRYEKTFRRERSDNVIMYLAGASYADFALPKVELSKAASMWTPAPEDIEQDLKGLATATSTLTAQVTDIDGRVSSQASQVTTLVSAQDRVNNGDIPGNVEVIVDLRDPKYGQDTYFPVVLSGFSTLYRQTVRVMAQLDNMSKPNWSTHPGGFSLTLQFQQGADGWGAAEKEIVIDNVGWRWTVSSQSPALNVGQMTNSSMPYVYLRGGGFYRLSVPKNRSVTICEPGGQVNGAGGEFVKPELYRADWVPVSLNGKTNTNTVKLQQTNEVVDGVKAVSTTSVNNNGFISGYGLISQLVNGVVTSAFGVDADYFYVGKSMSNAKKPFMVLTSPQTIGGVAYPAGVWMDVAVIANATIGTAHIRDASITNAKIVDLNADKITAGTINADRIGANSINAEKLTIGDFTNLWGNQYMKTNGARPQGIGTQWYGGGATIPELKGGGVQMWGRDHIAPYSTRIPLKPGDTFVIEYSAGQNSGPTKALGVGLWVFDGNGGQGSSPYQFGAAENLGALGGGWYRWRRTFQVWDNGSGQPAAYGCLYFQIEQGERESNPAYWTAGDIVIRKAVGAELIVNGTITANKLNVTELSAITGKIGVLQSSDSNGTMTLTNLYLQIKDGSGQERIFLGVR